MNTLDELKKFVTEANKNFGDMNPRDKEILTAEGIDKQFRNRMLNKVIITYGYVSEGKIIVDYFLCNNNGEKLTVDQYAAIQ